VSRTITDGGILYHGGHCEGPVSIEATGELVDIIGPISRSSDLPWIVPGFVDLQVNGAVGVDLLREPERAEEVGRFLARHGTAAWVPTLISAPDELLMRALEVLGRFCGRPPAADVAAPLGIHLEGPWLNPERAGAHPVEHLRHPDPAAWMRYQAAAQGAIAILTLAPEMEGSRELVELAAAGGTLVAAGHSLATYDLMKKAVGWGVRMVTHVNNANDWPQRRLTPEGWLGTEPGLIGSFLALPRLTGSLIADGYHIHPALLRPLVRVKGPGRLALVSDSTFAGTPEGTHQFGSSRYRVLPGVATTEDGSWLAGSTATMHRLVRVCCHDGRLPLAVVARMAAETPARLLRRYPFLGRLGPGSGASWVVLEPRSLAIRQVVLRGRRLPPAAG